MNHRRFKKKQKRVEAAFCLFILLFFATMSVGEETGDYIHYRLGVKYKNENKFDQAMEEFRKVLTAYPDNYNAYMQLAEIRKSQKMPRLEIYNLKKALAYNPGWGKAHLMLAEAYEQDVQFQNAIMEMQIYQQSCDPSEQDAIQQSIDKLVKKVKKGRDANGSEAAVHTPLAERGNDSSAMKPASENVFPSEKKKSPTPAMVSVKKQEKAAPVSTPNVKKLPPPPFSPDQTIDIQLKKALSLYEQGKIDEALLLVKKALLIKPSYAAAYYYGGIMRYKQGNLDKAKYNFARSLSFPEAAVFAHYYLGKIFASQKLQRRAIEELSTFLSQAPDGQEKNEALQLLRELKKITGDSSDATAAQTPLRQVAKECEPAVAESGYSVIEMRIDSLLTMEVVDTLTDPGQAMLTGVKEFKAGRFDNAIREFKKTMASYPTGAVAAPCSYNMGVCYMKMRLFPNSDNQFDNLRDRHPGHPLAAQGLFLKAFSYFERGNMTTAEKCFREFIQKYRHHAWTPKAYEKLGDVYNDLKQLTKAIDAYSQALTLATDISDRLYAGFKLGNTCLEAGNPERAIAAFKKVIDLGEGKRLYMRVADSYYKIADCHYRQKDYKNALENYQKVTRKYPSYQETPWGLFQMGNIYKNTRDYRKAADAYKELIKNYPDDYWAKQARWKLDDTMWENEYQTVLQ
jgi:tetratricopeptide (TPR) repeat protein